ncbi:MAG TPA: L-histidine N(alpha)-methyltransferase [Polyangiaceae bacterium]
MTSTQHVSSAAPDVVAGLHAEKKRLPCRLLYDLRGARLFERICTLPEYYLARSEIALYTRHLGELAADVGPSARVIEPGSGAADKTRMLLASLESPAVYVPIDVCGEQLDVAARSLREEHPGLEVAQLHGDYMRPLRLPRTSTPHARTVLFFPGSTIGNFEPQEAQSFLDRFGKLAGPGAIILLGADSNGDADALLRAYDDREGVTAAFNLNVLAHLNRTHAASFDLRAFAHRAVWNAARSRVEMHLVSLRDQTVRVAGTHVRFDEGEAVVTEHCYKHTPRALESLLARAGWRTRRAHPDEHARMHLWVAERV